MVLVFQHVHDALLLPRPRGNAPTITELYSLCLRIRCKYRALLTLKRSPFTSTLAVRTARILATSHDIFECGRNRSPLAASKSPSWRRTSKPTGKPVPRPDLAETRTPGAEPVRVKYACACTSVCLVSVCVCVSNGNQQSARVSCGGRTVAFLTPPVAVVFRGEIAFTLHRRCSLH